MQNVCAILVHLTASYLDNFVPAGLASDYSFQQICNNPNLSRNTTSDDLDLEDQ